VLQAQATPRPHAQTVCVFWLGDRCYGLDTRLVGEVAVVGRVAAVPLARAGVLGVFSLRGVPAALVDLAKVLGLPAGGVPATGATVLVLRATSAILCGVPIQRVDAIVPVAAERLRPPGSGAEHAAVAGFLDPPRGPVVTLLDPEVLLERLALLRHASGGDE
jgi:chemotaxis signal transduction protein